MAGNIGCSSPNERNLSLSVALATEGALDQVNTQIARLQKKLHYFFEDASA